MAYLSNHLQALEEGHWFKLICGASLQHLPAVRNLTLAYTLAGADCIDVAADPAVITAAQSALQVAKDFVELAQEKGFNPEKTSPLLMVSLNDGEDPHFRKAEFDSTQCPPECIRPCENICPAQAIVFNNNQLEDFSGVISQKCYGCGRCLPACPYEIIYTSSYVSTPGAIAPLILSSGVDAIEIHTQIGRLEGFKRLWSAILPWVDKLKLLAISCPDGDGVIEYMKSLYAAIAPLPCPLIWQTDGRPMSGDIGKGTTLTTVKFGQKVLTAKLPGYVQLAGGTNSYTVAKLKAMGLLNDFRLPVLDVGLEKSPSNSPCIPPRGEISNHQSKIAGVAYGSYARVLLSSVLEQLEVKEVNQANVPVNVRLETEPDLLWQAVSLAHSLVSQLKLQQQYP
ncbi:circadian clock protein LdpA [Calothrix rhizosoleniae]|uniref:circadian clock protein LdpA n=1 Tax=Calothrix rhizosoleniae TaxID=888997 RepID=UPI000B4A492B|nr:LdpA C-terminal domain-containing domain [Calothrix rhizosoleniae]